MRIHKTFAAAIFAAFFFIATLPARAGDSPTLLGFDWRFDPAKSLRANLAGGDGGYGGGDSFRFTGVLGGGGEAAFAAAQGGSWLKVGALALGAAGLTYLLVCNGDETVTASAGTGIYRWTTYESDGSLGAGRDIGDPTSADFADYGYAARLTVDPDLEYAYQYEHGPAGSFQNDAGGDTTADAVGSYNDQAWYAGADVQDRDRYDGANTNTATATSTRVADDGATAVTDSAADNVIASTPEEERVTTRKKRDKC